MQLHAESHIDGKLDNDQEREQYNDELLEQRLKEAAVKMERMNRLKERKEAKLENKRRESVGKEVSNLKWAFERKRKTIERGPRLSSIVRNPFGDVVCTMELPTVRLRTSISSHGYLTVWKTPHISKKGKRRPVMVDFCASVVHKTTKVEDVALCACFCCPVPTAQEVSTKEKVVSCRFFCADYTGMGFILDVTLARVPRLPSTEHIEFCVPPPDSTDISEAEAERKKERLARRLSRKTSLTGAKGVVGDTRNEMDVEGNAEHGTSGGMAWNADKWKRSWDADPGLMMRHMNMDADVDLSRFIIANRIVCQRALSTSNQITSCAAISYSATCSDDTGSGANVLPMIITCAYEYVKLWDTSLCAIWTISLSEHLPASIIAASTTPRKGRRKLSSLGTMRARRRRSSLASSYTSEPTASSAAAIDPSKDIVRCICVLSGNAIALGLGTGSIVLVEWENLERLFRRAGVDDRVRFPKSLAPWIDVCDVVYHPFY